MLADLSPFTTTGTNADSVTFDSAVRVDHRSNQTSESHAAGQTSLLLTLPLSTDHAPLHRQLGVFRRCGVDLAESTLVDWFAAGAHLMQPTTRWIPRPRALHPLPWERFVDRTRGRSRVR